MSVPRGKELVTRDRPVTVQIKALKSLNDLCGRPGCTQKLLLLDGPLGQRPLGCSQLLHTCTSQKALPPPVPQQASSTQRPSKSHQKYSCASNWFYYLCVPSHREWGYSCSWTAHLYAFLPQKEMWRETFQRISFCFFIFVRLFLKSKLGLKGVLLDGILTGLV